MCFCKNELVCLDANPFAIAKGWRGPYTFSFAACRPKEASVSRIGLGDFVVDIVSGCTVSMRRPILAVYLLTK